MNASTLQQLIKLILSPKMQFHYDFEKQKEVYNIRGQKMDEDGLF